MRQNPRKRRISAAERDAIYQRSYRTAVACVISTVTETDLFTIPEIQELWERVNKTCELVINGELKLSRMVSQLEQKYGIKVRRWVNLPVKTLYDALKQAKIDFSLAAALIMWEVAKLDRIDSEGFVAIWEKAHDKLDSINRGYVTLEDIAQALVEEYGITVGGVQIDATV